MASLAEIFEWFMTGKKPTQAQFWASWGSFWHKEEKIPQSAISNLTNVLNEKVEKTQFDAHKTDETAHDALFAAKADLVGGKVPLEQLPNFEPKPWIPKAYQVNDVVLYIGKYWVANATTISTDIPGTSSKWSEVFTNYISNHTNINLIPNYNLGLSNIIQKNTYSDTNNTWHPNNGTPTLAVVDNFDGFDKVLKGTLKVGDRINFATQSIFLDKTIIDNTVLLNYGFWVKVPDSFTGTISLVLTKSDGTGTSDSTYSSYFIQHSKNWRFYTQRKGFKITTVTDSVYLRLFINNINGTSSSEIYFTNPILLKTDYQIEPGVYKGIDVPYIPNENKPVQYTDLYALKDNKFKDAEFSQQKIGSSAFVGSIWSMDWGGASTFPATYSFDNIDTPVGNSALKINVLKRSSDGLKSSAQPTQSIVIPTNLTGRDSKFSFGYWMKRDSVTVTCRSIVQYYTKSDFTGGKPTVVTYNSLIESEVVGSWVFVKFNAITLPKDCKALKISARIDWDSSVLTPLDTIYNVYLTGFNVDFNSEKILGYTTNIDEINGSIYGEVLKRLKGKKWCTYGDSITASMSYGTGYQKNVIERYNLVHYLRGIGSSGVTPNETFTAFVDADGYYLARPPQAQPPGSFEILAQGYQQDRVNTIPLDSDIVSIALGANDWELTLGTIDDPETALTFYGKYQQMLNRIYARVPNAEIILHTPIWSITAKNNQIEEKRDAIFKIGRKYGYRVIDVGGNCGINKNNYTKYMLPNDGVHPNETGNNRMSVPILSDFLKIYG